MPYTLNGIAQDAGALPEPVSGDGVTFVPLAAVTEMLGGYATWDALTKSIGLELGTHKARVEADNASAEADGNIISLQAAPYIEGDKVFVPVRFFEAALNCEVHANGDDINIQTR